MERRRFAVVAYGQARTFRHLISRRKNNLSNVKGGDRSPPWWFFGSWLCDHDTEQRALLGVQTQFARKAGCPFAVQKKPLAVSVTSPFGQLDRPSLYCRMMEPVPTEPVPTEP